MLLSVPIQLRVEHKSRKHEERLAIGAQRPSQYVHHALPREASASVWLTLISLFKKPHLSFTIRFVTLPPGYDCPCSDCKSTTNEKKGDASIVQTIFRKIYSMTVVGRSAMECIANKT